MPGQQQGKRDIVVFDVGMVLVEWDPRHLYRRIFADSAAMEHFLTVVCPPAWNAAQDAGRPWAEAEAEAIARHPAMAGEVRAFRARWHEMVPGAIEGSVAMLEDLDAAGVPLYAITNFAADTFAETRRRFPFFQRFRGIVCSGEIGIIKPDARIYQRLAAEHGVDLARTVFLDDSRANCDAARALGMHAIEFTRPEPARRELVSLGLPIRP